MQTVFFSLGSNLGERQQHLQQALTYLAHHTPALRLLACSPLYESAPQYVTEQPPFLNCVCQAETALEPLAVLALCKTIEQAVGRQPTFRYGPRVIDVDIVAYGTTVQLWEQPWLELPHARLHERAFVLLPLLSIAPDWHDPRNGKSAAQLLAALPSPLGLRWWAAAATAAAT